MITIKNFRVGPVPQNGRWVWPANKGPAEEATDILNSMINEFGDLKSFVHKPRADGYPLDQVWDCVAIFEKRGLNDENQGLDEEKKDGSS